jgi:hypothetical protein
MPGHRLPGRRRQRRLSASGSALWLRSSAHWSALVRGSAQAPPGLAGPRAAPGSRAPRCPRFDPQGTDPTRERPESASWPCETAVLAQAPWRCCPLDRNGPAADHAQGRFDGHRPLPMARRLVPTARGAPSRHRPTTSHPSLGRSTGQVVGQKPLQTPFRQGGNGQRRIGQTSGAGNQGAIDHIQPRMAVDPAVRIADHPHHGAA